jgi:hypothetical protein
MIKVTVLYNLPEGTDEDEFIKWRTTDHHQANIGQPGVIKSDFYRIVGTPVVGPDRPASTKAPYRFVTEAYWETIESFNRAWNDPEYQRRLGPAVAKITDAIFLVSEEIQSHTTE